MFDMTEAQARIRAVCFVVILSSAVYVVAIAAHACCDPRDVAQS
jgi:hypothetical protein